MTYLKHANVSNHFEENIRDIIYKDLALSQEEKNTYNSIPFINVLARHQEYMSRIISPQKYHVNISKNLQDEINNNKFNDNETIVGLKILIQKLQNSEKITPYLSRKINDKEYNDMLFNDWGIYHLHLGTSFESDGFVKRTKNVLFLTKNRNEIYLIDVLPHGNGNLPWTKKVCLKR